MAKFNYIDFYGVAVDHVTDDDRKEFTVDRFIEAIDWTAVYSTGYKFDHPEIDKMYFMQFVFHDKMKGVEERLQYALEHEQMGFLKSCLEIYDPRTSKFHVPSNSSYVFAPWYEEECRQILEEGLR